MKIHEYLLNAIKGHLDLGHCVSEIDDSFLLEIDTKEGTVPEIRCRFMYDREEKFLGIYDAKEEAIQLSIVFKTKQEGEYAVGKLQEIAERCEISPNIPKDLEAPGVVTLISTAITYDDEDDLRKAKYFTSWFAASVIYNETL